MLIGEIRNQVDAIWSAFATGGISNPMEVITQFKPRERLWVRKGMSSMKVLLIAFLLSFTSLCTGQSTTTVTVGRSPVVLPTPSGFGRVTPEMRLVSQIATQLVYEKNEQFAFFIPESGLGVALANKVPAIRRRIVIQAPKALIGRSIDQRFFEALKNTVKDGQDPIGAVLEREMPSLMNRASDRLSQAIDERVRIGMSSMIPLPYHYEDSSSITFSVVGKADIVMGEVASQDVFVSTHSIAKVRDTILYVYVYGGPNDLDWTRAMSRAYLSELHALNPL
jgi:hypothetical protein